MKHLILRHTNVLILCFSVPQVAWWIFPASRYQSFANELCKWAIWWCAVNLAFRIRADVWVQKQPRMCWTGSVTQEPHPSSRVSSRFLWCLWADGRLRERAILAPVWTVSQANWEEAQLSSVRKEHWNLCLCWTDWPLVCPFFENSQCFATQSI